MIKQIIIVPRDKVVDNEITLAIAKAPMKLITRLFESGKNFIGRHEATEYEKTVLEWIDKHDQETIILQTDTTDDMQAFFWTAEMMGIPSDYVYKKGTDTPLVAVLGPYTTEALDEIVGTLDPYNP